VRRALFALSFLTLALYSCGGGGGDETAYTPPTPTKSTLVGQVVTSVVKNAKVCLENAFQNFSACTATDKDGIFKIEVPYGLEVAKVRVETEGGKKIGDAWVKIDVNRGLTVTPITLSENSPTFAKLLKAAIHVLGGDPTVTAPEIDLSLSATVKDAAGEEVADIKGALKEGKELKIVVGKNDCTLDPAAFTLSCQTPEGKVDVDCTDIPVNYGGGTVSLAVPSTDISLPEFLKTIGSKKWVVVVYGEGDNNLQDFLKKDAQEIGLAVAQMPDPSKVEVIMLADFGSLEDGIYYSMPDGSWKFYPYPGEIDGGSPQTLKKLLMEVKDKFNPENVALILWDHGDGWRSRETRAVAFDDKGSPYISLRLLVKTLKELAKEGFPVKLVGFDACEMGMAEVIWPLFKYVSTVEWVVASEILEPGDGWHYLEWLKELSPDTTTEELAKRAVDTYQGFYEESSNGSLENLTLGAFSRKGMEEFIKVLNGTSWAAKYSEDPAFWEWRDLVLDQTAIDQTDLPFRAYADVLSVAQAVLDWSVQREDRDSEVLNWAMGLVDVYDSLVKSGDFYIYKAGSYEWSGISVLFPRRKDFNDPFLYMVFTDGQTYDYFESCNPDTLTAEVVVQSDGNQTYQVTDYPCNPFRNNWIFDESSGSWHRDPDWVSLVEAYVNAMKSGS